MMVALLMTIGAIPSATLADEGKRIAFVVGINKYEKLGKNLERAVNDAREVSRTLRNIGFQVTEGIDVTTSEFDAKWQNVLNSLTKEDTFVLFFSGHGVEVDGENLLLPRDIPYFKYGRHQLFKRQAVSVSELMNDLRTGDRQHPKVTVMILDACRENPTIPPEYRTKSGKSKGGLAEVKNTGGTFILYAAAPGTVSLDRLGPDDTDPNSVYTRSLLPLLNQANLSIRDLAVKVKERVYALTETEQIPEYTDGLIGQFCLAGCVANVAKDRREPEPAQSVPQQPKLNFTEMLAEFKRQQEMKENAPSPQPELGQAVPQQADQLQAMIRPPQGLSIGKISSQIIGKDGAPMVMVSVGEFMMGSPDGEGKKDEHPRHQVMVDGFYMDKFEVTVEKYAEFMRAKNRSEPEHWDQVDGNKHRNFPVVGADWHDAKTYCEWAGKRLPTEAEWEKAARGTDGRAYPWGNEPPKGPFDAFMFANFMNTLNLRVDEDSYSKRVKAVDHADFGQTSYGLKGMAGNVSEWTADWYGEDYYGKSPVRNPTGPPSGQFRVLRGGSWHSALVDVRSANRDMEAPTMRRGDIGFRCAQDIPK